MTMEELFTKEEMDEALRRILSDKKYRQKYIKAPSDNLRRYYLLEESFVVHGETEKVDGLIFGAAAMICQLQDAFDLDDWKYEFDYATTSPYKWKCTERVRGFLHDSHWKEEYWHA